MPMTSQIELIVARIVLFEKFFERENVFSKQSDTIYQA